MRCPGCGCEFAQLPQIQTVSATHIDTVTIICSCGHETTMTGVQFERMKHGEGIEQANTPRPVLDTEIVGFRTWNLADNKLLPVSRERPWVPGKNEAVCELPGGGSNNHQAPDHLCGCGLHAYSEAGAHIIHGHVAGAVKAWGKIEVHDNGFRAQYAEILGLTATQFSFDKNPYEDLKRVAKAYGVAVVAPWELRDLALEHGIEVPDEHRPKGYTRAADTQAIRDAFNISMQTLQPNSAPLFRWTSATDTTSSDDERFWRKLKNTRASFGRP